MTQSPSRPTSRGRFRPSLINAASVAVVGVCLLAKAPGVRVDAARADAFDQATVAIDASRVENRISPRLYGHFAEFMYEDIKYGLHAELLRNRGFEESASAIGLPRYWERHPDDRNDDPTIKFRWDDAIAYPDRRPVPSERVEHSLRVEMPASNGQLRGFMQPRVPLRAGIEHRGYVWLRTWDFSGRLVAALEQDRTGGRIYATADVGPVTADGAWKQYRFALTPTEGDPLGRLTFLFEGRGRVWMDQVSLIPGDAVDDVRADVYQRIAALRPAFIRWPGGNVAQDYHWTWGIGPRDERPEWINLAWSNEREPSDFGTHEFLRLSRRLDAEPHLVVNIEGRGATAEEAAAWVQYVNGASSTPQGTVRARNGSPEAFGVKTWELGNEIWGDWVRGHSDADTYARNYLRYRDAMLAVDPSLRLIAVGDNDMAWNRTVLGRIGPRLDYLAIHHYYGLTDGEREHANLMARPLVYERFYKDVARVLGELAPGHAVRLIINEWNTGLPVPLQHSMQSALYGARLMNVFERSGDTVDMTAVSDLVNGWSGGIIQASRHDVFVTPTYLAIRLYNEHLGRDRLATAITSPAFDSSLEGKNVPVLDVVSTRSEDGRRLFVKAVNTSRDRTLRTSVTVSGATVAPDGTVQILNGSAIDTANSFGTPDAVTVRTTTLRAGPRFTLDLEPHSITVMTLPIAGGR